MAEQKNNAVATAGNIANKLHGAAQVVRGAVTSDFVAVVSGATKLLSPKVIAGIIATILLIVMLPVLIIFSLPQVLFNWGTLQDTELFERHEHANYLLSCYDDADVSEEDLLWLISIDAVKNNQDIMKMSQSSVLDMITRFFSASGEHGESGEILSEEIRNKSPDEVMNELGFDDNQKNWATLMVNTVKQAKANNDPNLPIAAGGTNNGIPSEAYNDETFAKLINEAEKYLGYPYVFGGSSPSTSFDCSGFVCWVYTHSGVHNLPRTTAQGIYNQCTRVSSSEAKPGDLVFFQGTYNAGETVTHIGIYVGNNRMLHCGSPIQYTSIDTSYWRSHFYAFGRLS